MTTEVVLGEALSHLFDHRGRTPKKLGGDFSTIGIPVVSAQNVKCGRLMISDEIRYVTEEMWHRWMPTKLSQGDVLLTSEAPLGEVAFLKDDARLCLGQRLFGLRADARCLHGRYLYYILQSPRVRADLLSRATGTTAQGIRQVELVKVKIPLPPLPEQKVIAGILGALDDKIELSRKTNETLAAMARALFTSWFVDFDPVRAKTEGRPPAGMDADLAALFPDAFEESALGPIPKGWCVGSLGGFVEVLMGASPPGETYNNAGVGTPLVNGPVEFGEYFTQRTKWTTSPTRTCRPGDLVFCVRGSTTGRSVIADGVYALGRGVAALRSRADDQRFTTALIQSELARLLTKTTGSVFPNLSRDDIKAFLCLVPPPPVRATFHIRADAFLRLVEHQVREQEMLANCRDTLLPKLISGELPLSGAERAIEATT